MSGEGMDPVLFGAMLAEIDKATEHITPEYLERRLAEIEQRVANMSAEERIGYERRGEAAILLTNANRRRAALDGIADDVIQRLADAAERGYEPHQLRQRPKPPIAVTHDAYAGPLRWQTCGGCGKPWPCPDAPLTEREQDRLDEWRMDESEAR